MTRIKLITAGLLAAAALGVTAPAQAAETDRCERKLERIEQQFRVLEERVGWEAAAAWWNDHAWPTYYRQCGG